MKRFVALVLFSLFLLILGRNLTFLPVIDQLDFRSDQQKTKDLKQKIKEFIAKQKKSPGIFSIYYKDIKSKEEFGIEENKVLTGASLNKLIIIAYLYHLAGNNKINLEEKIVVQEDDIQDYGTGQLRYEKPGGIHSLKTLAQLSLEKSDNTAAHILGIKLGRDNIQNYAKEINLFSTDMKENKITAFDLGTFFELLYTRKITTEPLTRELFDFLKDTDFEDRLPRYIHNDVAIYHKTGDGLNFVHDAGIIDDGKNPFILAVLVHDVADEKSAKDEIGKIAQYIYEARTP